MGATTPACVKGASEILCTYHDQKAGGSWHLYVLDDGKTWHASHLASVPSGLPKSPVQPKTGTERAVETGNA